MEKPTLFQQHKVEDPLKKREIFAMSLRTSKRKQILALKRLNLDSKIGALNESFQTSEEQVQLFVRSNSQEFQNTFCSNLLEQLTKQNDFQNEVNLRILINLTFANKNCSWFLSTFPNLQAIVSVACPKTLVDIFWLLEHICIDLEEWKDMFSRSLWLVLQEAHIFSLLKEAVLEKNLLKLIHSLPHVLLTYATISKEERRDFSNLETEAKEFIDLLVQHTNFEREEEISLLNEFLESGIAADVSVQSFEEFLFTSKNEIKPNVAALMLTAGQILSPKALETIRVNNVWTKNGAFVELLGESLTIDSFDSDFIKFLAESAGQVGVDVQVPALKSLCKFPEIAVEQEAVHDLLEQILRNPKCFTLRALSLALDLVKVLVFSKTFAKNERLQAAIIPNTENLALHRNSDVARKAQEVLTYFENLD